MKDNPYQTPKSDLTVDTVKMPRTWPWKIFFFLSVALMALMVAAITFTEMLEVSVLESIDLIISFVTLVGLFGLAFNKPIGKQVFWKYVFYLNSISFVVSGVLFPLLGIEIYGLVTEINTDFLVGLILSALFVWACYVYAFKRPQIWDQV